MNRPAGTRGEATYTALTLRSACSHSSCKLPMLGVEGTPSRSLGGQGAFSHVREGPLIPKRTAGAFRSRPCTLTTKREGLAPPFLDYPPRSSDGAAMPRPHAVRRQTSVTRASRSKARLLDEPTRRDSWRSHVHYTHCAARASFKLQTANVGGRGTPCSLRGQGGLLSRERRPPLIPQENGRAFRSRPCTLTTKGRGLAPPFLISTLSSDGAAMPRPHAVRRQTSVTRASRVRRGAG